MSRMSQANSFMIEFSLVEQETTGQSTKSADNCGTGAGGFKEGNVCATGSSKQDEIAEFRRRRELGERFDPATHGKDKPIENMQDAVAKLREQPDSVMDGWFRNGDENYKPRIVRMLSKDPELLSASQHVMFEQAKLTGETELSKGEFLNTEMTLYRGGKVGTPGFDSYTTDRAVAEKFSSQSGEPVTEISIKPKETYGMFTTTGEQEVLISSEVSLAKSGVSAKSGSMREMVSRVIDGGGFTYNPATGSSPTKGFAVSPFKDREFVMDLSEPGKDIGVFRKQLRETCREFTRNNKDLLGRKGAHFGGWWDKDAKKFYLDVSLVVPDRAEAMRVAKDNDQEAIFDLETMETISAR